MSTDYILSVDLGTHGPKVALVTTGGEIAGWQFEPTTLKLFPPGGAEQDPHEWWQAICTATERLLAEAQVPIEQVVAVSCTSQWSGTVAVDRDGQPLMNAIIWMDTRGKDYIEPMIGGLIRVDGLGVFKALRSVRYTGGAPGKAGKDPSAHILFIKEAFPEVYAETYKFLEPKDYLNLRLTGMFAASFDSIALHWLTDNRDLSRVRYVPSLVKSSTIDPAKLPELKQAVDILGTLSPEAASQLGLSPNTRVVMGTPDIPSAAIGSCAVADYQAHLYIGSSSWLTCHVPFKKTDIAHNMASIPSAIPNRYLVGNEQESAGACIDHLVDKLLYPDDALQTGEKPPDVYERLERLAASAPPGSNRLIFMPWLYGERTPVDDATVRGGFFNQTLQTTRADLARSVYEGVAFNGRWLLLHVEKFIKRRLDTIDIIGGGARSALWCQIHADIFGRTVRQAAEPILANVRGAGLLAAVALGRLQFDQIPACAKWAATFEPNDENRDIYDELFAEYVRLYRRNRRIFARLNRGQG